METIELVVDALAEGERIDKYLADSCGLSRALVQQFIEEGHVRLNGSRTVKSGKLAAGDCLSLHIPPPRDIAAQPQNIPLAIVYEDKHLLVVDKPKGMVVHPAPGHLQDTLVNALLYHCKGSLSGIGGEIRPGIVHRIDKDTSGLLVVAKDDDTHQGLACQFSAHSLARVYQAVAYGRFREKEGKIDAPIGRDKADRKKMAVTHQNAKSAVTNYRVIGEYVGFTHLELRLETGRTHQIRVHMAQAGHPLAGDVLYGPKKVIQRLQGQCLHAGVLGFVHPASGRQMLFESPLPPYFTEFLRAIA